MQACLQSLQRCSLSFAKIVQTESRDASLLAIFAEVQPIFCKDKKNILLNKVVLNKVVKNVTLQRYWFMIIRARNILKALFVS